MGTLNNKDDVGMTVAKCLVCKIARLDGQFYYSFKNTPTTDRHVAAVVCQHITSDPVKCQGCINPAKFDPDRAVITRRQLLFNLYLNPNGDAS